MRGAREFPSAQGVLGCVIMHRLGWSESLCFSHLEILSFRFPLGTQWGDRITKKTFTIESPNDEEISEVLHKIGL